MNKRGFSLTEMMITVTIIGGLAAMAIPTYVRTIRRSRQSEARSNLSSYYTAEKSAFLAFHAYLGNFSAVGFKPDGVLIYRITTGQNSNLTTLYGGTLPSYVKSGCVTTDTQSGVGSSVCAGFNNYGSGAGWKESGLGSASVIGPSAPASAPGAATATTFTGRASGWIGGAVQADEWTIDQTMTVNNPNDGLK